MFVIKSQDNRSTWPDIHGSPKEFATRGAAEMYARKPMVRELYGKARIAPADCPHCGDNHRVDSPCP